MNTRIAQQFHHRFLVFVSILAIPILAVILLRAFGLTEAEDPEVAVISRDLYYGLIWLSIVTISIFGSSLGLWMSFFVRKVDQSAFLTARIDRTLFTVFAIFSIILGTVTLAIFLGGFINGSLFPTFSVDSYYFDGDFKPSDIGKLLIWSFAAGFSERLIPDFMEKLTKQFSSQDNGENKPANEHVSVEESEDLQAIPSGKTEKT